MTAPFRVSMVRAAFAAFVALIAGTLVLNGLAPLHSASAGSQAPRTADEQSMYRQAMEKADQQIADEVKAHSQLMSNLEYLTTEIGPRLTGSPQMQRASQWTMERFRAYGLEAHLETTQIAHAWYRGNDTAEILSPIHRTIQIRSLAWTKPTNGSVEAEVVELRGESQEELQQQAGKVTGKIVMGPPAKLPPPEELVENAYDAVIPPSHGVPGRNRGRFRQSARWLASQNPAIVLLDSGKIDNLFTMGSFSRYEPTQMPVAFITHEDASLLDRLLQTGPVRMRINLNGTFSPGPVPTSITVAEIPGTQNPAERVIIGGHLDSWDLGQGALDNGTGAMAVLEAARTLHSLGWKPHRTLTFILFTGEEQGGIGADLYVKNHAAELGNVDAVLIHDTGTGKVFSIALENLYETASLMTEIWRPVQEVFDIQPLSTRMFGASDHVPFLERGVPAYFCVQLPDHYREAHHSQTDTFDKVIPDQINEGAAVLASWMWNTSEMPERLPHHAAAAQSGEE